MTTTREHLDFLLNAADSALIARNSLDQPPLGCLSAEWRDAHRQAGLLYRAAHAERLRLWKADRWGKWMTKHDRALVSISGEL